MNLTGLLNDCVREQLAAGRCTVEEVAVYAEQRHGAEIAAHGQELAARQVRGIVRRAFRDLTQNDEQGQEALPGLALPSAIAVRPAGAAADEEEGGIYYVRADQATWEEVLAGLEEREQNIARAVARRDRYQEAIDRLRPYMANDPTCTVAEALRREAAGRALVGAEVPA